MKIATKLKLIFLITILVLAASFMFSVGSAEAAGVPCSSPDSSNTCGVVASYNMVARCTLSGSDKEPNGTRILGNQECSFFGTNVGGLYEGPGGTPTAYTTPTPPGWTYAKSGNMKRSITNEEFKDDPYYNIRFFGGPVRVFQPKADDSSMLRIGNNYTYWTGCSCGGTSVAKSSCPSSIFMGSPNGQSGFDTTIQSGDTIDFTVKNECRPNNGYGEWGVGDATITLNEATQCFTKEYLAWLNNNGISYQNVTDYHPTAPGVCQPENAPPPDLKVVWTENNSASISKTVNAGQSVTVPFKFSNVGGAGSVINNITCNPSAPSGWSATLPSNCQTTLQAE